METDTTEKSLEFHASLQKFIDHVEKLRNEDDPAGDGFTREFRIIRELGIKMKEENTYPALEGRKQCNVKKNRYRDILPFDETRVVLDEIEGEEGTGYINANFIKDQMGSNTYIASQGPVAATIVDFWRMIWQYRVKVVAMACRLVEMGKKKCEMYWPEAMNEPAEFGDFEVTMVDSEELADDCTRRTLSVKKDGGTHTVTQFHYTGWPDHDIPKDFDVILEMIAEMRQIKITDTNSAPMVIHCSAGCGRTGTICAIDYAWDLLKHGHLDENFNLFEIIKQLRTQRQSMIQAPEQYMMAHVTVAELFKKHLDLMEDHTYGNFNFDEAEDSQTEDNKSELSIPTSSSRKNSCLDLEVQSMVKHVTEASTLSEEESSKLQTPKSANDTSITHKFNVLEIQNVPVTAQSANDYYNVKAGKADPKQTISETTGVVNGNKKPLLASQSSRVESTNQQGRFVTSISISSGKEALTSTKSEPTKRNSGGVKPGPKYNSFNEKPQSSIAPVLPAKPNEALYSFADETSNSSYSTLTNYNSTKSANPYSYADAPLAASSSRPQQPPQLPPNKPTYPYSYAQVSNQQGNGNDAYSFAKEEAPNIYTGVNKSKAAVVKQNGFPVDSVYEAISVGNQVRNVPPPIPLRQYNIEEDQDTPVSRRSTVPQVFLTNRQCSIFLELDAQADEVTPTPDSVTQGKSPMMSTLKNLFSTGGKTSANEHILPSDIPGFQKRIEKRPSGPRDKPQIWGQQHL